MTLEKNAAAIVKEMESLVPLPSQPHDEGSEWIETNGLGGWAGSSITGCHTRRYHGLLVAATKPPAERMNLLSKLDETIVLENKRFDLHTNLYDNSTIYPTGYRHLVSFKKDIFPEWTFSVNGIELTRTIAMVHSENTTLVLYEVKKAPAPFTLELLPLIAARGYHSLQHSSHNIFWDADFRDGIFKNRPFEEAPELFISVPGSAYRHHPAWFYHFNYAVEQYRGLDFEEDLFNHGTFSIELEQGDKLGIIISTEDPRGRDAHALFEQEKQRKLQLLSQAGNERKQAGNLSFLQHLILAADQFIVKRDENLRTVIAGYHWFTDWGRDTMIALPGLCLATGRWDDAKKILAAFAKNVSMGMLPNRFTDNQEPPEYNNVDGTLWYFIAVYRYLQVTDDTGFVINELLPVLKNIIDWHFKGTRYNIHADSDGLLFEGEKGQQLTWMDARIGNWVVTPRMGKPVEIQALWYNAQMIFAELLELNDQSQDAALVHTSAAKTKKSFTEKFWYSEGNYLYDVIDETGTPDTSLRPNQLLAASLPFTLLEEDQILAVLAVVKEKLYTPPGLRSLSADDPQYVPVYGGNPVKRDSSYHQGTVWGWLLGPYIEAMMKVKNDISGASKVISDFRYHLSEAAVGNLSEIFDGQAPHLPRGCVAQAWTVGEILRVTKEYHLEF